MVDPQTMSDFPNNTDASRKDKHKQLFEALKQNFQGLIDYEFRHGTLLIIILGWVLTTQRAQEIFAVSHTIKMMFTFAIVLLTSFHAMWVFRQYFRSAELYLLLTTKVKYMEPEYFDSQRIRSNAERFDGEVFAERIREFIEAKREQYEESFFR